MLQSENVTENGPHPISTLGRERQVLVVDDNNTNRWAVSRMLVSLGHKVTLAGNGFEGGILFLTSSYDLAIIHLDVPQMNVWELARILKEHSPKTPVIVATGLNKGEPLAELGRDKADAIIPKPFMLKELEGTVQRLLSSGI